MEADIIGYNRNILIHIIPHSLSRVVSPQNMFGKVMSIVSWKTNYVSSASSTGVYTKFIFHDCCAISIECMDYGLLWMIVIVILVKPS